MVTVATARQLALALPGASEGQHQNHPDFRVAGRIFATLWNTERHMVLILSPLRALELIRDSPTVFAANGWTRQGAVTITLEELSATQLKSLLREAWERRALPRATRSRSAAQRVAPRRPRKTRRR